MNETDARAKSINPEDACYWHAEGTTWIGHRDDTGFAVALDDYVAAHLLTTEEIEAIPSATELLEEIRARTSISPMSPKDRLLVAHRDEYFAMFWKYAEEDEEDARHQRCKR
jgi:hypothetical protein